MWIWWIIWEIFVSHLTLKLILTYLCEFNASTLHVKKTFLIDIPQNSYIEMHQTGLDTARMSIPVIRSYLATYEILELRIAYSERADLITRDPKEKCPRHTYVHQFWPLWPLPPRMRSHDSVSLSLGVSETAWKHSLASSLYNACIF